MNGNQAKSSENDTSSVKPPPSTDTTVDPRFVQITADNDEINRRISTFIDRQRVRVNFANIQEFCGVEHNTGTSRADGITLTLLLELKAEMRDLRDQLGNIQDLLHNVTGLGNVSDDDISLTLPIKNLSELRNVEEQMTEDSVVRQKLLKKLSVCGGKTVQKAVRRMIDVLSSNEVQRSLNWSGLNGKQAFRKLECCEILQEAVRRNKRTASATNDDIKEQVQLYLHGASDRCGGRVERLKKAKLHMTAQDGEPDSD